MMSYDAYHSLLDSEISCHLGAAGTKNLEGTARIRIGLVIFYEKNNKPSVGEANPREQIQVISGTNY